MISLFLPNLPLAPRVQALARDSLLMPNPQTLVKRLFEPTSYPAKKSKSGVSPKILVDFMPKTTFLNLTAAFSIMERFQSLVKLKLKWVVVSIPLSLVLVINPKIVFPGQR